MCNFKKYFVFILLIYQSFKQVLTQDIVDCTGTELVTSVLNDPIDLNTQGIIKVYENVTINEILSTANNDFDGKYLDARLETVMGGKPGDITKNLVIFTTENFTYYAREQSETRILLKIELGCDAGKERIIVFFQPFIEANYFTPLFSQTLYELTLPTPIFAGFELTSMFDIMARDDDLTNNKINFTSFTSTAHHIGVSTKNVTTNSDDKKTQYANLTLGRIYLELPQQIEFVIIATDNGMPPRSSNATVIIRADPQRMLPSAPKFEKTLYKAFMNVVFAMEPIIINLMPGTYDRQVKFSMNGSLLNGFEMLNQGNGSIQIMWNATKVNQSSIMANKQWQLEVKAEHSQLAANAVAIVIVELADFHSYFHFMSTYYDGRIESDGILYMTPIIFYPFVYKPDIEFTFLENPFNMFAVMNDAFRVEVLLRSNFSLDAFANSSFIKVALQASWEQLTAVCYIVIKLPPRNISDQQQPQQQQQQLLQFEKPLYVGNITQLNLLQMESIVLQTDANASQLNEFQLIGKWSHLFHLNVSGSHVKLEMDVTRNLSDFNKNSPILLILEAKNSIGKASTSVVIYTPQKDNHIKQRHIFETPTAMGKISINNGSQILSMNRIVIKNSRNLRNYEFNFNESVYTNNFEIKWNLNTNQFQLELKEPLPNKTLEENHFILLPITAKLNGSNEVLDTLTVFIEMPVKECPAVSNHLSFGTGSYIFTTYFNETGSLGFVNVHKDDSNTTLNYNLEVENDTLAQVLSINPFSGELFLYSTIKEGSYKFNITVENILNHEKATVKALLKVKAKEECRLYQGPAVEKTVVIKHIDEERRYHGLWNMTFSENCTFRIVEMWPKEKAYIYLNESSNMLDTLAVDREDRVFKDMQEAEIIIKLGLNCVDNKVDLLNISASQNILKLNNKTRMTRSILWPFNDTLYTQNLTFAPDIMWLHLKIDDINDNAPQFAMANGPQYLAYPSGKVALEVYPEYLTQITATDRDLGLNAKIRYSIRENDYFAIEAETGKVYPKGKVLQPQQQSELIIVAVDQDGNGLMSGTVVIVQGLANDFYSLITLEANSSKSLEKITQELSKEMGCDVKILKMSYVPQMEQRKTRAHENQNNLVCKAWIYAFRDQQLVQCKELQEKFLGNSPIPSIVNIESYEQAGLHSDIKQKKTSTVGYIVAISLLSVISCSSIGFIIWRFYYFNNTKMGCSTKGTTTGNGQPMECSLYADNNKTTTSSHVKFSTFNDNTKSDELYQ